MPKRKLVRVLEGGIEAEPPVWLMRQAGRYLPEYREIRSRAGNFLELCYTPELAIEATLQPVKRFGFDAAILFSDILVIPDALGRNVRFVETEGPRLDPLVAGDVSKLDASRVEKCLLPVIEAVRGTRKALPKDSALLGFCGAPWTVATYMIAGKATPEQGPARRFAYEHRDALTGLMHLLADISADYLVAQIEAGADAVQIFDSWAGVLPEQEFDTWCVQPVKRMVDRVRARAPGARIIGFPKGAGNHYLNYRSQTGVDAVGLDTTVPAALGKAVQRSGAIQGQLDPMALVAGGAALDASVDRIMAAYRDGPFIFNLGHGIVPETPVAHVERMLARIRKR